MPTASKNYYETLGVKKNASANVVTMPGAPWAVLAEDWRLDARLRGRPMRPLVGGNGMRAESTRHGISNDPVQTSTAKTTTRQILGHGKYLTAWRSPALLCR